MQNTSRFCRALHGRRAFARRDSERLRHTADGSFVLPAANPGVRIEPDFVAEEEQAQLVAACQEYAARYGYAHDGDTRSLALGADGAVEQSGDLVNNVRVTGRLERPDLPQRLPPWGYGEVFQENALPPPFQQLAARVKQLAPLGPLRDVTINGRQNGFFQLDPHLDPQAPAVGAGCVLGLGEPGLSTWCDPTRRWTAGGWARRLHHVAALHRGAHLHAQPRGVGCQRP